MTYWNEKGTYQNLRKACFKKMEEEGVSGWDEFSKPENAYWALLNGMSGIYYGKFNDGDGVEGAIDNNRVHGFSTLKDFLDLARRYDAPKSVINYIDSGYCYGDGDTQLEKAMDDIIQFVAKEHKVQILRRSKRLRKK